MNVMIYEVVSLRYIDRRKGMITKSTHKVELHRQKSSLYMAIP